MGIILDLIVVAIILVTVAFSAKRGFVRVAVELVGFIAAILLTFAVSTPLANLTYDKFIEPSLVKSVSSSTGETASQVVDSTWDSLPSFIKNNSASLGISKDSYNEKISTNLAQGAETAAKTASQNVIKPVATKFIGLIISVVLLIVLMFVVKILAKYMNKLFSFSIVGKLNRVLGGIIGLPKGIILAIAFCMLVSLIVSFTANGIWIFNQETINDTAIFKFFNGLTPFN